MFELDWVKMKEIRVEVHGPFQSLEKPGTFAISLNEPGTNRGCLITIGEYETKNIVFVKEKIKLPRPVTYDLLKSIIDKLAAKVEKVIITEYRELEDIYFSIIQITENNKKIEIDARPSDAINLALRVKCQIFVSEELLKEDHLLKDPETLPNSPPLSDSDDTIAEWFRNLDPDKIPKE